MPGRLWFHVRSAPSKTTSVEGCYQYVDGGIPDP